MNDIDKNIALLKDILNRTTSYYNLIKYKHPELFNFIFEYTKKLDEYGIKINFNTRCFFVINKWTDFQICKNDNCKNKIIRNILNIHNPRYEYCCIKCAQTSKYTVEKRNSTCLKRYGHINAGQGQVARKKRLETMNKLYGCDYTLQNKQLLQKTMKHKSPEKFKNGIQKAKEKWKLKTKEELLQIYKRRSETYKSRTGYENPSQNPTTERKKKQPYLFNNIFFKNKWELAFWIYLRDNNIDFDYQPKIKYIYFDDFGKQHFYHPDFKINNEIIEIKGSQFFENHDVSKRMINPYDKSHKSDYLYEAKHQCMIKNNIKILTDNDIAPILEFINEKYGRTYLENFKVKPKLKIDFCK